MKRKTAQSDNNWISFSDLMTGLMVIFMFIAISYILEIQKKQKEQEAIFENFQDTKHALYLELKNEFQDDLYRWGVELDQDLSIKFTNPEILFDLGKSKINPYFADILDQFLPRYFNILLKEQYYNNISEVRIEGHTDTVPALHYDEDPYIGNVILSQLRSAEVLKYFHKTPYYHNLNEKDKQRISFLLTANGLSFGRTLDDNKQLTFLSGKPINSLFSRRVEFRIVTNSNKVIEEVLNKMEQLHERK